MILICHHKVKITSSTAVLKKIRDIITRHFNNIGFVGENLEVNEAYLGFVELSRTDALTITKKITLSRKYLSFFTHERNFSENATPFVLCKFVKTLHVSILYGFNLSSFLSLQ